MATIQLNKKTIVVREYKPIFYNADEVLPELSMDERDKSRTSGSCLVITDRHTYHMAWLCEDPSDESLYWWDLGAEDALDGNVVKWTRLDIFPRKTDSVRLERNALNRINREILREPEATPA